MSSFFPLLLLSPFYNSRWHGCLQPLRDAGCSCVGLERLLLIQRQSVGLRTVSVPAVEAVAVVPALAVSLMADEQQVWEELFLQLVAPKLQM